MKKLVLAAIAAVSCAEVRADLNVSGYGSFDVSSAYVLYGGRHSIAAMILTVRRSIEEWIFWIVVNAVEVFMWVREWIAGNGNISVLLMWLLFLANGIYLLSLWLRIERKNARQTV